MLDNIPANITETDLRNALRNCGTVKKVWIYIRKDAEEREMAAAEEKKSKAKGRGKTKESLSSPSRGNVHVTIGSFHDVYTDPMEKVKAKQREHAENINMLHAYLQERGVETVLKAKEDDEVADVEEHDHALDLEELDDTSLMSIPIPEEPVEEVDTEGVEEEEEEKKKKKPRLKSKFLTRTIKDRVLKVLLPPLLYRLHSSLPC